MCSRNIPAVPDSARKFVGLTCPVCAGKEATLDFMRFLDPHGAERIDVDIFECSARKHTYVVSEEGLRLLAAEGKRCRDRKVFHLETIEG